MSTSLLLSPQPCGHGADPAGDSVGCRGSHVPGHTVCLAHLTDTARTDYLTGLAPGADIDHRGTPFTQDLLEALLHALHDPSTGKRRLGRALFTGAQFFGEANFIGAQFAGDAWFDGAQFFGDARFSGAQFSGTTRFSGAQFSGRAGFVGAQFSSEAGFYEARFSAGAVFVEAQFSRYAWFVGTEFCGDARFERAHFEGVSDLGPLVCAGRVMLSGAVFVLPVTLEIAATAVVCERTRWESTATVRVRYATVDLSHAVLTAPSAVITHTTPFTSVGRTMGEDLLTGPGTPPRSSDRARVVSVQGVDAAHLVLTDTDLTDCLFSGAFHLDQIRLEGRTTFAPAPTGWHRRSMRPVRFTRRRVLAEEHHWRAHTAGQPALSAGEDPEPHLWRPGPHHTGPARTPGPEDVAALYRQLRKAFEDGKNEPGAADFYYGECEMRRHDPTGTTKGEHHLLWWYWLLSGYGLRAWRAFSCLLAAMSLTVLFLMSIGLPTNTPDSATTGTLNGSKISLNTSTPTPAIHTEWPQRMTWARAEKATRVAVNSVVFRSSGQNLTTAGTYIEMTSRLLEPTLLALGVLAIRSRIKR
ncbi:pentapeptide repeat-containing protein [Streptomyces stelliscabiei]|nr:pentapeptide repeat-containing protein [Streptomyces stelliscabiei]MDX2557264.1 pentapeptide repeat-containing protein [Streptomyces stelliscabiei]MDX2616346.1 pentapeptide repeat-containing protein [Streptomyces stelliscabiei]MDX2641047.1 pentapeptide repeat-containing protein [Streptomyces stelliscabiei]MDX2665109.1 pentapeptide repeat-containing protein [Streptomyces stelliscabiei]MDX2716216.1 pentapeptide repeat-containing protein [Streptomyces stelliscabiei]